jgi:hypothetical protein
MRATAVVIVLACAALAVAATAFAWLDPGTTNFVEKSLGGSKAVEVIFPLGVLTLAVTGALIASRYPRHMVAWCFLLAALVGELVLAFRSYGLYGIATAPGGAPAATFVLGLSNRFWLFPSCVLTLAILLFPDGHLPSPRWRPVVWMTVGAMMLSAAEALPVPTSVGSLTWLASLGSFMWTAALLATGASLVVRFRRALGAERQQLKWFAYTVAIAALLNPLQQLAHWASISYDLPDIALLVTSFTAIVVVSIPVSAAIAILRYRLYDIDIVIERTLVYGAVSATLGATYIAAVVILQGLLRPVTGGNEFAVALSTLLVVALFQPIRTRAQDAVDRRFHRARYDAARTIDAFSVRLRSDVELDSVRADLIAVIHDTIHPAHASVWLRGGRR